MSIFIFHLISYIFFIIASYWITIMTKDIIQLSQVTDPYSGYASCPDTQHAFISYSGKNQTLWVEKSEQVIQEFINKLDSFKNFQEAYTFLAKKRHEIALELKQRNDEGRVEYYGMFRKEGDHFRQIISAGDGEQFWKWQKNKVFELTYKLINPIKNIYQNAEKKSGYYEDNFIICLQENVDVDHQRAIYYSISVKSPFEKKDKNFDILSNIELYEFDEDKKLNTIRIEYTPINSYNQEKYYKIANHYYQTLINWKSENGIKTFLICVLFVLVI